MRGRSSPQTVAMTESRGEGGGQGRGGMIFFSLPFLELPKTLFGRDQAAQLPTID
jgi:hypothetical protein